MHLDVFVFHEQLLWIFYPSVKARRRPLERAERRRYRHPFQTRCIQVFVLPSRTHWPWISPRSSSEIKNSQSPSPARITNSLPGSMKMNAAFVKSASASIASLRTVMALRRNLRVASSLFLSFAWFPSFPHRFVISLPRTPDDISTTSIILSRGKS